MSMHIRTCRLRAAGAGYPISSAAQRQMMKAELRSGWPAAADAAYASLCTAVSEATAAAWSSRLTVRNSELVLWRLLRIGATPYFILGTSRDGSIRLRIDTPWDWRESYRLLSLIVEPLAGGQPLVGWSARYRGEGFGTGVHDRRACRGPLEPWALWTASRGQGISRLAT